MVIVLLALSIFVLVVLITMLTIILIDERVNKQSKKKSLISTLYKKIKKMYN